MADVAEQVSQLNLDQDVNPWSVAGGTDESGNAISIDYEALSR